MTHDFIGQVTEDLISKTGWENLHHLYIIVPTRRASVFFMDKIKKAMEEASMMTPVMAPHCVTIDDFIGLFTDLVEEEELILICHLYELYQQLVRSYDEDGKEVPSASIDIFYSWGRQLLNDFTSLDYARLSGPQIKSFFETAIDQHQMEDVRIDEDVARRLKELLQFDENEVAHTIRNQYHAIWGQLYEIYDKFNEEGHIYRGARMRDALTHVEEKLADNLKDARFAFVGFNYLLKAEEELFRKLQSANSYYYWDTWPEFDANSRAFCYVHQYAEATMFGNQFNDCNKREQTGCENSNPAKPIKLVSCTSTQAQIQYVHQWLSQSREGTTAIVIADESLLEPVVYALPRSVSGKVNITKGFPLRNTHLYAETMQLMDSPLIAQSYARGESLEALDMLVNQLPAPPMVTTQESGSQTWQWNLRWESYYQIRTRILSLRQTIATSELDLLRHLSLPTLTNLIRRQMEMVTLPFHGETVNDIQIMGVLETRLMDYDNLLIIGAEEGIVPKRQIDHSFLPYGLRKSQKMQTADETCDIYAYNFFRLLQRSQHAELVFSESGEHSMSRFVMQILTSRQFAPSKYRIAEKPEHQEYDADAYFHDLFHGGSGVKRYLDVIRQRQAEEDLQWELARQAGSENATQKVLTKRNRMTLSPSALNTYLACPRRFYLQSIEGIEWEEDTSVIMPANVYGDLVHHSLEEYYKAQKGGETISIEEAMQRGLAELNRKASLRHPVVDQEGQVQEHYPQQKHPIEWKAAKRQIQAVVNYFESEAEASTQIVMLEDKLYSAIQLEIDGEEVTIHVGGIVDRLDIVTEANGQRYLRVLDYKTGKYDKAKVEAKSLSELFENRLQKTTHNQDYIRQTLIYCMACQDEQNASKLGAAVSAAQLPVKPSILFVPEITRRGYHDMHLKIDKQAITNFTEQAEGNLYSDFREGLSKLVKEIVPCTDFPACEQAECTAFCPFTLICNRKVKEW